MRKTFPVVLVVVAILAASGSSASAQEAASGTPQIIGAPKKMDLVGSWLETVTFPPETGRPPLKSLASFHGDGTMVCSDQGGVTTNPPGVYTSCHGVWEHLDDRTSAYTSLALISDLSGNLVAYLKVRGIFTVSQSGTTYNGTSFAQVLGIDGTVLFSVDVTNAGQRIPLELP